jgi:hypothetical protein
MLSLQPEVVPFRDFMLSLIDAAAIGIKITDVKSISRGNVFLITIYENNIPIYDAFVTCYRDFYYFQELIWYNENICIFNAYTNIESEYWFYPADYSSERTSYDEFIADTENKSEYAVNSGLWTDITYNLDGSFTHSITKEEDIPQYDDNF